MRRVGPSVDKGPMFYLVYENDHGSWEVRAYWSVGAANRRAHELKAWGFAAFVEAR